MENAVFNNCKFSRAEMYQTNFANSKFINCSFEGADFIEANLQNAIFENVDFNLAYMSKVKINGSIFINHTNIDSATKLSFDISNDNETKIIDGKEAINWIFEHSKN